MFYNKEYTTNGDNIVDTETGKKLNIKTNNSVDKLGIKSNLGQGEDPIEVEITPKKDVKEKFVKGFKKALAVGTVVLFTLGTIYGVTGVKDVYNAYKNFKELNQFEKDIKNVKESEDISKENVISEDLKNKNNRSHPEDYEI